MSYYSTQHRVNYTQAIAFIRSHGHFANITKEGLLAIDYKPGHEDGEWYDLPHLFALDDDGAVSSREVRDWLGY